MAKALQDPTPSSAVARLLNRDAASRATQPTLASIASSEPAEFAPVVQTTGRIKDTAAPRIKREFILSEDTEATLCELLEMFRRTTRSRLTASQLFRAMLKATKRAMPVLQYEATQLGSMRLPGNGRDMHRQREEFESRLATALASGMRTAASLQGSAHELDSARDGPGR